MWRNSYNLQGSDTPLQFLQGSGLAWGLQSREQRGSFPDVRDFRAVVARDAAREALGDIRQGPEFKTSTPQNASPYVLGASYVSKCILSLTLDLNKTLPVTTALTPSAT